MKMICALTLLFVGFAGPFGSADAAPLIFAEGALRAELSWTQGPRLNEASAMKIEWISGVDQTRTEPPGPVKVSLWMPAHGHGSSPVTLAKLGSEPGVYQASDMYFTMAGDWDVRVNLKYSNGREETKMLKVTLKGGGHHH